MYCKKCGAELKEKVQFCPNCGMKVELQINSSSGNAAPQISNNAAASSANNAKDDLESKQQEDTTNGEDQKQFEFLVEKKLGRLTLNYTETDIVLFPNHFTIHKHKIYFPNIKGKPEDYDISWNEVVDIASKKKIETSYLIFAIASVILGFFNPVLFLMAAIFIWLGLQRLFTINLRNGNKVIFGKQYGDSEVQFLEQFNEIWNSSKGDNNSAL